MAKDKKEAQPGQGGEIDIGALRLDYEGRFDERDIPSPSIRLPLNATCRALDGIRAIAQILYSNEIERQSQGAQGQPLNERTAYGLFEALVALAEVGNAKATDVGEQIFQQSRRGEQ